MACQLRVRSNPRANSRPANEKLSLGPGAVQLLALWFLCCLLGELALGGTQNQGQSLGTEVPFSSDLVTERILWLISKKQLFVVTWGTRGGGGGGLQA